MGAVTVPTSGSAYADANIVIYTVEQHPCYSPAVRPSWMAADAGVDRVFTSELVLLETLVGPYRSGATQLAADYSEVGPSQLSPQCGDNFFVRRPFGELDRVDRSKPPAVVYHMKLGAAAEAKAATHLPKCFPVGEITPLGLLPPMRTNWPGPSSIISNRKPSCPGGVLAQVELMFSAKTIQQAMGGGLPHEEELRGMWRDFTFQAHEILTCGLLS